MADIATASLDGLPPDLNLGFFTEQLSKRGKERGYSLFTGAYIHGMELHSVLLMKHLLVDKNVIIH